MEGEIKMERELFDNMKRERIAKKALSDKKRQEEMETVDNSIAFSEKLYIIVLSLALGIFFDYLFIDKALGISLPIFTLALISFFLWCNRRRIKIERNMGWFLLIPIFLLSMCFALFSNRILAGINILLIPFLMVVSSILIFNPELKWDSIKFIWRVPQRAIVLAFENFYKPVSFIVKETKVAGKNPMSSTKKGIIKGVIISFPLLIVILSLLNSADMVFSYYIGNFTEIFKYINLEREFSHGFIIVLVFLYIFGYTWSFKYNYISYEDEQIKFKPWEPSTPITVILLLNIVYLLFTIVQFSYLYGGEGSLPQGFTYSEYARRGFFELVAVTVINFAVIMSSLSFMKEDNKKANRVAGILLTLLILFTFNMLYSAHYKMSLYEGSYGYTYLRVFVHYFMIILTLLLSTALIGIWYRSFSMAKIMIVTLLIMYIALNYLNVDKFIARKNIERYKNGADIDIVYLTGLSYDAFPYMKELMNDRDTELANKINKYMEEQQKTLKLKQSWSEFNLSILRAKYIDSDL